LNKKTSEKAIKFIKEKQNSIAITAIAAIFAVLAILSFNYLAQQKQDEAQKAFGEALALFSNENDDALEKLREVSDDYKGTVYAGYSLALLGKTLLDKEEYREAAAVFDEALKAKQSAPFLTAQLYDMKATALEYDGALDDALSAYKKALAVKNNFYRKNEIILKSALLNLRMGQNDEAKKLFKEIIADIKAEEKYLRIAKNELSVLEK
jgi:hypothetical protein